MRRRAARVAASLLAFLSWAPASAQTADPCQGLEARVEAPTDVELEDLSLSPAYKGRAVRTKGTVDFVIDPETLRRRKFFLKEGLSRLPVAACPHIAREFDDVAGRRPRLQVRGLFTELPVAPASGPPEVGILIWSYTDMAELERPRRTSEGAGLAQLLEAPDSQLGRTVRLTGQFGGRNLLKDLPADSAPDPLAWVLREGRQAIWVVGKRPEGSGFKLDPSYASDAGKWLVVEGKLERCGALFCLRARKVSLSAPPS